jgi:hypothetical protein
MSRKRQTKQSREDLRATLLAAGQEILHEEGLETASRNLTFKRVFERVERESGLRLTNASVIGRVWENQADYQADVLVSIAQDRGRPEIGLTIDAVNAIFDGIDLSTPESRATALRQVCRAGGEASSRALADSTNWSLWISVVAMATTPADPDQGKRLLSALAEGYEAVVEFWVETLSGLMGHFGLRIRQPWTERQFTIAVTAYTEGCSLRQRIDGHIDEVVLPTGPNGEDQKWTLFAAGIEALINHFFEPDPDFTPTSS